MAITYPLDTPESIGIESITLRAVNAVATSQSPFSYKQQIISHGGQRWEADVSLPTTRKDLMAPWVSMLIALKGQTGTFLLADPDYDSPQGDVKSCLITGSTGDETVSAALNGTIKAGDYIQLGFGQAARLHKVLQDQTGSQRNLLEWSEEFDNVVWNKAVGATVTADATADPNGVVTADLVQGGGSTVSEVRQVFSAAGGTTYTISLTVKNNDSVTSQLLFRQDGTGDTGFILNWSGSSLSLQAAGATKFDKVDLGNGWWRIWLEQETDPTTTEIRLSFQPDRDAGTAGVYLWGAQVEVGSLSTYQKTEDAASFSTDDLEIWPALRANQSSSTAILNKPNGVFRLKNNSTEWSVNNSSSYGLSFEAVEVIT